MFKITTIEEFWEVVDGIRLEKELNWSELVGNNAKLAVSKKWNPTLANILQMQKKLEVSLLNTLIYELFEPAAPIEKNPKSPEKMEQIYQWIQSDNWMEDEKIVQKVQELAKTII